MSKRLGFYPAGGGEWQIAVAPFERWQSISFAASKKLSGLSSQRCKMTVLLNNYDVSIAEKEVKIALNYLNWEGVPYEIKKGRARGKGNTFQIHFQHDEKHLMFESFAQKKVIERDVALTATKHLKAFLDAEVAVEEYLADQLLLPMALAKGGEFTTTEPSDHTLTNIAVIEQMLPVQFQVEQLSERQWKIKVLS
ncbi:RNA 3'-terminal phosphate cyclase [Pleionea litopenaei]|uniref:RNA 3'-terminal-phosphate cyclase (ATP) n=1 Tax=Pleionea litopenaei TaxID=3070815 RepID=A0AA51RWF4_9GAMM|nr:RNA 3'-terminal phosphate cyclase [Pleionea sp. HL-JVS1]WMS88906.1 RNA 3'-terminal phosphate cyclase [Pleionea sp. HL-JVS1]